MKWWWRAAALFGPALLAFGCRAPGLATPDDPRLTPAVMTVAEIGDFVLTVPLSQRLDPAGVVTVHFPKSWFPNPWPLNKAVQMVDENAPHYLSARADGTDLNLTWDYFGPGGERERFEHLMQVRSPIPLRAGSTLTVTFASTTAPYVAGTDAIGVTIATGDGKVYEMVAEYQVRPGPIASVRLTGPSAAGVGEEVALHAVAVDRFSNLATDYSASGVVHGLGQDFALEVEAGLGRASWRPEQAGNHWPVLQIGDRQVDGNPIQVSRQLPVDRVYWGDLHSHSRISMDAVGFGDFAYARDVSRLDFYASTEHAEDDDFPAGTTRLGISAVEWRQVIDQVEEFYLPHHFVTLLAYECGLRGGHYNVYFRSLEGTPLPAHDVGNVAELWLRLERGEAFTVPHHTGKRQARLEELPATSPGLQELGAILGPATRRHGHDWSVLNSRRSLTPAIEIYSSHGSSERFDPEDPLSYENVGYSGAISGDGPHYSQDAWAGGHHLGVIAASDNHTAHPGMPERGLTAVRTAELTRPAVFDALRGRRSWGTTGERIIVDLTWGDALMGERVAEAAAQGREIELSVIAPRSIAYVELMSFTPGTGWAVHRRWQQPGRSLGASVASLRPKPGRVIYLRAELEGLTGGRRARAWSSPIRVIRDGGQGRGSRRQSPQDNSRAANS